MSQSKRRNSGDTGLVRDTKLHWLLLYSHKAASWKVAQKWHGYLTAALALAEVESWTKHLHKIPPACVRLLWHFGWTPVDGRKSWMKSFAKHSGCVSPRRSGSHWNRCLLALIDWTHANYPMMILSRVSLIISGSLQIWQRRNKLFTIEITLSLIYSPKFNMALLELINNPCIPDHNIMKSITWCFFHVTDITTLFEKCCNMNLIGGWIGKLWGDSVYVRWLQHDRKSYRTNLLVIWWCETFMSIMSTPPWPSLGYVPMLKWLPTRKKVLSVPSKCLQFVCLVHQWGRTHLT